MGRNPRVLEGSVDGIKKGVTIWNLNSYAEFFMQVLEKYQQDYTESLEFVIWRAMHHRRAEGIPIVGKLFYVRGHRRGHVGKACGRMLGHDLLIKDSSPKIGDGRQYIRVAVRRTEENQRLVEVMRQIMEENVKDGR